MRVIVVVANVPDAVLTRDEQAMACQLYCHSCGGYSDIIDSNRDELECSLCHSGAIEVVEQVGVMTLLESGHSLAR